jgi:hypothetical protein
MRCGDCEPPEEACRVRNPGSWSPSHTHAASGARFWPMRAPESPGNSVRGVRWVDGLRGLLHRAVLRT